MPELQDENTANSEYWIVYYLNTDAFKKLLQNDDTGKRCRLYIVLCLWLVDTSLIARLLDQFAENAITAASAAKAEKKRADAGGRSSTYYLNVYVCDCREAKWSCFWEEWSSLAVRMGVRCTSRLGHGCHQTQVRFLMLLLSLVSHLTALTRSQL